MARFQEGDRVKVKGEQGRGEATVIGIDPVSGTYRVRFDAMEAVDSKGNKVTQEGVAGYAPAGTMSKRRKS